MRGKGKNVKKTRYIMSYVIYHNFGNTIQKEMQTWKTLTHNL